jgi:demethylmacrocin O-methyltransferase
VNLLEIGIGGYDNPDYGGNSLRMWKRYFHHGKIYGIDIYDKSKFDEHRIKTFQGNQNDIGFLDKILTRIGKIDVIIDDGSHINQDVIASFQFLFPRLNSGGIYVVEDTETSYIDSYGGDSQNLNNPNTTVNFFKNLIDCVHCESINKNILPDSLIDYNIKSMHFYDNIIFITKFS